MGDADKRRAVLIAMLSPLFLGTAPIFGKLAYRAGADPFTVAAVRTAIAAALLWSIFLIFWRRYTYIFPAGLLGCVVVGTVNGLGSLMYYNGLARLDASLAQLLNGMYLVFVLLMGLMGGQRFRPRTFLRITLALIAILLLTGAVYDRVDWLGVGLMVGNALMYAGHVVLSQRVLYEMPPQTFTLYTLSTMAVVVAIARLAYAAVAWVPVTTDALMAILGLAITTALSRLTLFAGVSKLGSLQTALLGVAEIGVALTLAFAFLGESLTPLQWVGVGFLVASIMLMKSESEVPEGVDPNAMFLPNMAGWLLFQSRKEAFTRAFLPMEDVQSIKSEALAVLKTLSPEELEAIRRMMGRSGSVLFEALEQEPIETAPTPIHNPHPGKDAATQERQDDGSEPIADAKGDESTIPSAKGGEGHVGER